MENNMCCAIFSPSPFLGRIKNGRGSGRRVSQYSRFDYRIFAIFRFFVWASVWFCPCFFRSALAEFDNDDSSTLRQIYSVVDSIYESTYRSEEYLATTSMNAEAANGYLRNIQQYTQSSAQGLGYYGTSATGTLKGDMTKILNYMGYGSGVTLAGSLTSLVNQTNQIKTNLGGDNYNTIADRLDDIINYLESRTTPTDYATETTLSAFKNKYEEISNQFLTSWGFVGGSDGTYRDYLESIFKVRPYSLQDMYGRAGNSPFPNENNSWFSMYYPEQTSSFYNPFEGLSWTFAQSLQTFSDVLMLNMQKQSWNDWYSHTNSVAHLDMIVSSLNSTPALRVDGTDDIGTIDENQLNITFDKATGDSAETIDLQPAFTNDLAELTTPAENVTNKVANLITYSKLSNRYKTPNVDDTNYRDYEITQDISDYNLQYGTRPQMTFRFTATARNLFRGFLSRERMATLRSIFLKLWAFLAIYCNFLIFKIFGKMGGNE